MTDDAKRPEREEVSYGAHLCVHSARALRLPAATAALSLSIYQRYYSRVSPRTNSVLWSASAAVLLAAKSDGVSRRVRDVSNVVHARIHGASPPLDYYGAPGHKWKHCIASAERDILSTLGFHLRIDTPHKLVLVFANTLREKSNAPDWLAAQAWHALLAAAWAAANDAMLLPEGALFVPEDVACACIERAAGEAGVVLPRQWAAVFGARDDVIRAVLYALDSLYCQSTPTFHDLAAALEDGIGINV